MALTKEFMGFSVLDKSSFVTSSNILFFNNHFTHRTGNHRFSVVNPVVLCCSDNKRFQRTTPLAAVTDNLVRVAPEKPVRFKVRAVITVRNKIKEDFKDSLVRHMDSFADKFGKNVVLQLVSTQVDLSKWFSRFFMIFFKLLSFWVIHSVLVYVGHY